MRAGLAATMPGRGRAAAARVAASPWFRRSGGSCSRTPRSARPRRRCRRGVRPRPGCGTPAAGTRRRGGCARVGRGEDGVAPPAQGEVRHGPAHESSGIIGRADGLAPGSHGDEARHRVGHRFHAPAADDESPQRRGIGDPARRGEGADDRLAHQRASMSAQEQVGTVVARGEGRGGRRPVHLVRPLETGGDGRLVPADEDAPVAPRSSAGAAQSGPQCDAGGADRSGRRGVGRVPGVPASSSRGFQKGGEEVLSRIL
jgi:hypothetical protein